uniref:Ig-like domain-containing protein n=1 Tax=Bombyx mori TaxID=7091 RepID=A0A8R2LZ63_BOMMO|nr:synaptogenesis protein syg-2 [Bombyx mori]
MLSFGLWYFVIAAASTAADTEVVVLRAVRGRNARLPCGQGKVFLDGPDSYVLWVKNERDVLYRFLNNETDNRAFASDRVYGTTCESGSCHDDTALLLKHVSDDDAGTYRCRVHYQASPSVDHVVDLKLVDSPGAPKIYNENNELIKLGYVGPISLGANLTFVCKVADDQPKTLVYWRRNGAVIKRAEAARSGLLIAEIRVVNATRNELDAHYECLAQNADVTDPLTASFVVKMFLPPMRVEIRLNNNLNFEAGQPRVVDCVVVGCVPPPSITWHLGDNMLRPSVHKELHDGNYTVSSLTLAPSLRDNKHDLTCRAHNSHLPNDLFENKVKLNVGFRPFCLSNRQDDVGAVHGEAETVTCVVEASPEPMQFSWTFADSKTLYTSVKKVSGHNHRYMSSLTWKPREEDLGQLVCRATNSFGEQKRPCTYTITPGGAPISPECVVIRSYPNVLRVQCKKAWNGGRPQTVHLEIVDESGKLLHNVTDPAGHFHVTDIEDERNLTAFVYASNVRGRSQSRIMRLQSMKPLTSSVSDDPPIPTWTRWLEAVAAGIAVAVAIASTAICIKAFKSREDFPDFSPDLVPRPDGVFHREPDFTREERVLGTTNITVNQLAACQNQYATPPVPSCRVMVGCAGHTPANDSCPATTQQSYFV